MAAAALLCACDEQPAVSDQTTSPAPSVMPSALPLVRNGGILHSGNYCHFLQQVASGNNTLPVVNGCQFYLTTPADLFATDGGDYSVSEVVGTATLGVGGPPDSRAMIVCRLSGRAIFWFWISSDSHWNIDSVDDVHHPKPLVAADQSEPLRMYINKGLNDVQFKCAGGATSRVVSLALNVNNHQFAALTVPMPAPDTQLARPATPWFVDLGARMTSPGTVNATVAKVTLYDHE